MPSIQKRLADLMERIPELSSFGIGHFDGDLTKPKEELKQIHVLNRERLKSEALGVAAILEWLNLNVVPTKTVNPTRSSYGLKHVVEKDLGYITNGAFIAAAILAGYPYKIHANYPNVTFGMSTRSLRAIQERQKKDAEVQGKTFYPGLFP